MLANIAKVALTLIALCLSQTAFSQSADELFALATRSYNSQNYQKAAEDFEKSAALSGNASAYHNAANAYLKQNKPGLAILNYERARYINPRSPETNANIASLKSQLGTHERERTLVDTIFGELSNGEWIVVAVSSFLICALCFALIPLFIKGKNRFKLLGYISAIAFALSCAGTIYWSEMRSTAISISQDAMLKLSPAANAPATVAFPEGRSAVIRREHGNYLLLQTPDKKWGWANKRDVRTLWGD